MANTCHYSVHLLVADKKYHIPTKYFFSHSAPNSLIVDVINERNCHAYARPSPSDKESKCLDRLGKKSYLLMAL